MIWLKMREAGEGKDILEAVVEATRTLLGRLFSFCWHVCVI
jgi:hypothetical protein